MRFTIKTKLALTFTILTILSCVMAGLAVVNLSNLNSQIGDIVTGPSAQVQHSDDIEINTLYMIRAEKNMIMDTNAAEISAALAEMNDFRQKVLDAVEQVKARRQHGRKGKG